MLRKALSGKANGLKKRGIAGFTLIELIIVIAVIGILVGIAIPVYGAIQKNAREGAVESSARDGVTVALAGHHQGHGQAAITEQVKKADSGKIIHDVGFTDEAIEVTARYSDGQGGTMASSTAVGRFSGEGAIPPSDDATFNPPMVVGESTRTRVGLTAHTASALTFEVTALSCPNGCGIFSNTQYFTTANARPDTFVQCRLPNGSVVRRTVLANGGFGSVTVGRTNYGGSMKGTITLTPCNSGETVMEVDYGIPANNGGSRVRWARPA